MSSEDTILRVIVVILAIVLLLPLLFMAVLMPVMGFWGWGHMWNGPLVGWGWILSWIVMLALLLGVGYLVYRVLGGATAVDSTDPALEELRVAYARGDLSDEEFEERRARLSREE